MYEKLAGFHIIDICSPTGLLSKGFSELVHNFYIEVLLNRMVAKSTVTDGQNSISEFWTVARVVGASVTWLL